MRKGQLKYTISPNLRVEAEYEVKNGELMIRLGLPYTLEYKCTYTREEDDNDFFDKGYALFELKHLIDKIFFVKKHREGFEFVLSEYRKAKEQKAFSSLDMIGFYHSLIKEHVSADLLPFWIDVYILEDILVVFN